LVYLLAYTGLRWGEAIGLRVREVDLERRRLKVIVNAVEVGGQIEVGTPKSHKRRSVRPDDLVFATDSGDHLRRTRVSSGQTPGAE
jgi:integrase